MEVESPVEQQNMILLNYDDLRRLMSELKQENTKEFVDEEDESAEDYIPTKKPKLEQQDISETEQSKTSSIVSMATSAFSNEYAYSFYKICSGFLFPIAILTLKSIKDARNTSLANHRTNYRPPQAQHHSSDSDSNSTMSQHEEQQFSRVNRQDKPYEHTVIARI